MTRATRLIRICTAVTITTTRTIIATATTTTTAMTTITDRPARAPNDRAGALFGSMSLTRTEAVGRFRTYFYVDRRSA